MTANGISKLSCAALASAVLLTSCDRAPEKTAESSEEMPSFEEVLKDGEKREKALAMMNPQLPANLTDAEIEKIVNGYVNSQGQSPDYWKIAELLETSRDRLTPFFIKVALAPGSEDRPPAKAKDVLFDTPLERALTYLPEGEQPELLPRLLALSADPDPLTRRDVATHLAAFGSDEVIPATISLLADPRSSEANSAMRGIAIALKAGRATPAFRSSLFDPITTIVRKGAQFGNTEGTLLLDLDAERARPILLQLLQENNLQAHHALEALNRARVPIAPETLLGILEANRNPGEDQLWRCSFYGGALLALARQKNPQARAEIDQVLAQKPSNPKGVPSYRNILLNKQEEASRALLAWEEFRMPDLWSRYESLGREGITEVERDLLSFAEGEIANGGFSQYFYNIDYDPRDDVATMKRLGAPEHAALLERSFKAFGWGGPHRDQEKRIEQLEKMSDKKSEILAACEQAWFASAENLTVLQNLYALKHRAELEKISSTQPKP